jgi:hypothetical protein
MLQTLLFNSLTQKGIENIKNLKIKYVLLHAAAIHRQKQQRILATSDADGPDEFDLDLREVLFQLRQELLHSLSVSSLTSCPVRQFLDFQSGQQKLVLIPKK